MHSRGQADNSELIGEHIKRIGSVANLPKRSPNKTLFSSLSHKGSTPSLGCSKSLASFRNFEKGTKPTSCKKGTAPGSVYKKIINGDIVKVSPPNKGNQTSRGLMTCKN